MKPLKNRDNQGKKWTKEDIKILKKLRDKNTPTGLIAYELKRSEEAIRSKASDENISLKPTNQSPYDRKVSQKKKGKK
jgi:hypothetical protein